jgi:hypothetical protein
MTIPSGCTFVEGDARPRGVGHRQSLTGPGPTGALPLGTYRYSITEADMSQSQRAARQQPSSYKENAGLWTWTLGKRSAVPRAETCGLDLPRGALQRLDLGIGRCCHLHPDGERGCRGVGLRSLRVVQRDSTSATGPCGGPKPT